MVAYAVAASGCVRVGVGCSLKAGFSSRGKVLAHVKWTLRRAAATSETRWACVAHQVCEPADVLPRRSTGHCPPPLGHRSRSCSSSRARSLLTWCNHRRGWRAQRAVSALSSLVCAPTLGPALRPSSLVSLAPGSWRHPWLPMLDGFNADLFVVHHWSSLLPLGNSDGCLRSLSRQRSSAPASSSTL